MVVVVGLPPHSQVKWEKNRKELKELFPEGLGFLVPSADEQIQNWGLFFSFPWFSTNYSSARPCNFGTPQGKWSRNLTFPDPFRKLEKCGHPPPPPHIEQHQPSFQVLCDSLYADNGATLKSLLSSPGAGELSERKTKSLFDRERDCKT